MSQSNKTLKLIIDLELKLQSSEVRKSINALDELLHDKFSEIGSCALIYSKQDILKRLPHSEFVEMKSSSFLGEYITESVFILKYDLERENVKSKRTSLWKFEKNKWELYFHQSTLLSVSK